MKLTDLFEVTSDIDRKMRRLLVSLTKIMELHKEGHANKYFGHYIAGVGKKIYPVSIEPYMMLGKKAGEVEKQIDGIKLMVHYPEQGHTEEDLRPLEKAIADSVAEGNHDKPLVMLIPAIYNYSTHRSYIIS